MDEDGFKPCLMSNHSVGGRSAAIVDDQEFHEAEVWEAVDDHHFESRSSNLRMKISKSANSFASSSGIGAHHHHGGQPQSSYPLLTPFWSHDSAGLSRKSFSSVSAFSNYNGNKRQQDVEAVHDEDGMIPPHEWVARRLARSQISSSSVCEGAGRTLKGRELSRVRNAVLAKTGFLEQ